MSGGAVTRHKNILSQPLYNWLWQISQQIVYMRSSFHVPVFFYQYAFFINDECGALDAHVFFPVHALFFHDAVQIAHRFLFIGKEREIKFILVAEVAVLFHAVAAHAKCGMPALPACTRKYCPSGRNKELPSRPCNRKEKYPVRRQTEV